MREKTSQVETEHLLTIVLCKICAWLLFCTSRIFTHSVKYSGRIKLIVFFALIHIWPNWLVAQQSPNITAPDVSSPSLSPPENSAPEADVPTANSDTRAEDKYGFKDVQRMLKELGYRVGEIDGIPGDLSSSAIKNFKKRHMFLSNTTDAVNSDFINALNNALESTMPASNYQRNCKVTDARNKLQEIGLPHPSYKSITDNDPEYYRATQLGNNAATAFIWAGNLMDGLGSIVQISAVLSTWGRALARSETLFWQKFDSGSDFEAERKEFMYWLYKREFWNAAVNSNKSSLKAAVGAGSEANRIGKIHDIMFSAGGVFDRPKEFSLNSMKIGYFSGPIENHLEDTQFKKLFERLVQLSFLERSSCSQVRRQ